MSGNRERYSPQFKFRVVVEALRGKGSREYPNPGEIIYYGTFPKARIGYRDHTLRFQPGWES